MTLLPLLLTLSQLTSVGALALDDSPAQPGEWGFRPVHESTASTTPPAFVWRPAEGAAAYALEVARDEAFTESVKQWPSLPWSSFAPDATLDAGVWYWRYAAIDDAGVQSPWSQARKFEVAADAKAFPKPGGAELAGRIPTEHPKLFLRPEEVPKFKEEIEKF